MLSAAQQRSKRHIHILTGMFFTIQSGCKLSTLEANCQIFIFRDAFLEGDFSGCVSVARAINNIQGLYGCIPNMVAHGRAAKAVINALDALNEKDSPKRTHQVSQIIMIHQYTRPFICMDSAYTTFWFCSPLCKYREGGVKLLLHLSYSFQFCHVSLTHLALPPSSPTSPLYVSFVNGEV